MQANYLIALSYAVDLVETYVSKNVCFSDAKTQRITVAMNSIENKHREIA